LEKGILAAYERSHTYVGTEHLLYGIADLDISADIFDTFDIDIEALVDHIESFFQNMERFPEVEDVSEMMEQIQEITGEDPSRPLQTPSKIPTKKQKTPSAKKTKNINSRKQKQATALDMFAVDLTDKYVQATIDPVIGREKEITRLMQILCRKTKNNPVLVGEPGVGKTAIAEGLAKRIIEGNVPDVLKRKQILSLDLTLMIAGTIYRGEFESRLKQVIQEIEQHPDVIVFIDELHTIIGAGSNQGTMDAANILKPALARGTLRCIGATTIDEYTKYIQSDPALERRFQAISVDEPSRDDAITILRGLKTYYEQFHSVTITDEAIVAAVDLSMKYIHETYLPDKAIDLMDEAAAAKTLIRKQSPDEKKYHKLLDQLDDIQDHKEEAIMEEHFDEATKWKKKELAIEKKIVLQKASLADVQQDLQKEVVDTTDIANVLSNRLSISPDVLLQNTWQRLDTLHEKLATHLVGQDTAIARVVDSLRQSYLRPEQKTRPRSSLLFVGPSGVGKTTLASILAEQLYHSHQALIRLDMSEFSESHGTSKLLGSPAGYIGHGERNLFTEQIRKRPHSIVLFDEIDKAHPDVRKLLLQILDDGVLTDSKGKKTYFNQAIIILTTNVGAELFRSHGIGFGRQAKDVEGMKDTAQQKIIEQKLNHELGTALMSRVQSTCIFSPLSTEHVETLITKHVSRLSDHLKTHHAMSIGLSKQAVAALCTELHNTEKGARHVEHSMDTIIHALVVDILKQKKRKKRYILKKEKESYVLS